MIGTIGATERGKLRQWKRAAAANYQLCDRLLHDPEMQRQVDEFAMRGSEAGRRRAFQRVNALVRRFGHLQEVRFTGRAPLALWAALAPRNAVTVNPATEGQKQDCVAVNYVLVGALAGPGRRGNIADGLWTVEISDHALLRVLQRDPAADLRPPPPDPYLTNVRFLVEPSIRWRDHEGRFRVDLSRWCGVEGGRSSRRAANGFTGWIAGLRDRCGCRGACADSGRSRLTTRP